MAAWNTWKLLRDEFVKRLKYGVRIMAGQKSDLAGEAEAVRVDTGRVETIEKLSVAGATPTAKVGTTGRLPATKTITFNAATAMVGTYRPKGGGVTVAGYFLGNTIPNIDRYFLAIVLVVIFVSALPALIHMWREYRGDLFNFLGAKWRALRSDEDSPRDP